MFFKKKKEIPSVKPKETRYLKGVEVDKEKGVLAHIEGMKYPMKGFPREKFLKKVLDPFKNKINDIIVKEIWKLAFDEVPDDKLSPAVREIARVLDEMIKREKTDGMKKKWTAYRKFIAAFLQEDLAYRYRAQWFLEHLDIKKVKLDKADKYYFRVKNFEVD